ncbi:MAG TPA: asparaginase [Candidatus Saccharimonadales bacterium]|nr:asparaginase [Candidatus Saccharimonadales bacterium]
MSPTADRRSSRPGQTRSRARGRADTPILVRQVRNGIEESVHRGDIVETDVDGRLIRQLGDADRIVTLRSTVKPFGAVALIEAGGIEAFELEPPEIAMMASSHSGEDSHVRTLQSVFRRAGVSQTLLACGNDGMPLDALTAARLARDGEKPGPIRHMCSGQHAVSLLLARLHDWDLETYWRPEHPSQVAYRSAVARAYGTTPEKLRTALDGCGVETYAFRLREVAQAYAMLADPSAVPAGDRRSEIAPALTIVRDAMLANPEMIGGRHDRLDTSLMKAVPGRVISKAGMEALRGISILAGARPGSANGAASGLAVKIEDGDGYDRGTWAASVEALRQAGVLDGQALRVLARYHSPVILDPHGRVGATAVAEFELAPVGELIG